MRNKRGSPAPVKHKHGGGGSQSPATSIGGSYILDRMLVPRVESYALNNSIEDHAEVADYLRRNHREYQRKQLGPFRGMVAKAIAVVQRSGGAQKPELSLQSPDDKHSRKKRKLDVASRTGGSTPKSPSGALRSGAGQGAGSSSSRKRRAEESGEDEDGFEQGEVGGEEGRWAARRKKQEAERGSDDNISDSDEDESGFDGSEGAGGSSSEPELDETGAAQIATAAAARHASGMNGSLLSLYAQPPSGNGAAAAAGVTSEGGGTGKGAGGKAPPAFAPRAMIAAAAAAAIAASKSAAAAKGEKALAQARGSKPVAETADGPSTSGRAFGSVSPFNIVLGATQPPPRTSIHTPHPPSSEPTPNSASSAAAAAATGTPPPAAAAPSLTANQEKPAPVQASVSEKSAQPAQPSAAAVAGPEGAAGLPTGKQGGGGDEEDSEAAAEGKATVKTLRKVKKGKGGPAAPGGARPRGSMGVGPGGGGGGGGMSLMPSALTAAKGITYDDLGGIEEVLSDIRELIEYPLKHPEVYAWLGVEPPRGVLLHGPPGCGKTALANAIANECGVPFLRVSAPEIVSGMSGESEAKLRGLFAEAVDLAPCIMFIDEIDAIFPKRETAQREMERRIVAQMLTCMDDLAGGAGPAGAHGGADQESGEEAPLKAARPHVIVIGATNRPDALDPALRRAGRFDREISLGIPTEAARVKILSVLTRRLRLEGDFDFRVVAKKTPGFVGADLTALIKEAAAIAVTRIFSRMDPSLHPAASPSPSTAAAAAAAPSTPSTLITLPAPPPTSATEPSPLSQSQPHPQPLLASLPTTDTSNTAETTATAVQQHPQAGAPQPIDPDPMDTDAPQATSDHPAPTSDSNPRAPAALTVGGTTAAAAAAAPQQPPLAVVAAQPQRPLLRFGGGPLGPADLRGLAITMADFLAALPKVQPSVRREGFTTTPDVTWEDVGSLDEVREELSFAITQPIAHPERFASMGLSSATGAVAHESGANFISIKGPELLNKYVGESERAVRQLFARARAAHPCVLFFDEMDALAPRRGTDSNAAAERVVNQLLTEMDGIDARLGVAATRRLPLADGVDVVSVANDPRAAGFSGADCAAVAREACVLALKESIAAGTGDGNTARIHQRHFDAALSRVQPSVSRKDIRIYDALRGKLRSSRGVGQQQPGKQQQLLQPTPVDDGTEAAAAGASDHPAAMEAEGTAVEGGEDEQSEGAAGVPAGARRPEGGRQGSERYGTGGESSAENPSNLHVQ
ncbi:MAG: hypothetical protein WDW36_002046 [Sanguina aurantia]